MCLCVYIWWSNSHCKGLAQRGLWVMRKWQWWLPGNQLLCERRGGSVPTAISNKWMEERRKRKKQTSPRWNTAKKREKEWVFCVYKGWQKMRFFSHVFYPWTLNQQNNWNKQQKSVLDSSQHWPSCRSLRALDNFKHPTTSSKKKKENPSIMSFGKNRCTQFNYTQ